MSQQLDLSKVIAKLNEKVSELTYSNAINSAQIEQLIELVGEKDAEIASLQGQIAELEDEEVEVVQKKKK